MFRLRGRWSARLRIGLLVVICAAIVRFAGGYGWCSLDWNWDGKRRSNDGSRWPAGDGVVITYVNGIFHSVPDWERLTSQLQALFGHEVRAFYNPSSGWWITDASKAGYNLVRRPANDNVAQALAKHLAKAVEDVGSRGRVLHLAHSGGALLTYLAAKHHLSRRQMSQIDVVTFGGARSLTRKYFPGRAVNYYARNDPLVMLDRRAAVIMKGTDNGDYQEIMAKHNTTFVFLEGRARHSLLDHSLEGPTYQHALRREAAAFRRRHFGPMSPLAWDYDSSLLRILRKKAAELSGVHDFFNGKLRLRQFRKKAGRITGIRGFFSGKQPLQLASSDLGLQSRLDIPPAQLKADQVTLGAPDRLWWRFMWSRNTSEVVSGEHSRSEGGRIVGVGGDSTTVVEGHEGVPQLQSGLLQRLASYWCGWGESEESDQIKGTEDVEQDSSEEEDLEEGYDVGVENVAGGLAGVGEEPQESRQSVLQRMWPLSNGMDKPPEVEPEAGASGDRLQRGHHRQKASPASIPDVPNSDNQGDENHLKEVLTEDEEETKTLSVGERDSVGTTGSSLGWFQEKLPWARALPLTEPCEDEKDKGDDGVPEIDSGNIESDHSSTGGAHGMPLAQVLEDGCVENEKVGVVREDLEMVEDMGSVEAQGSEDLQSERKGVSVPERASVGAAGSSLGWFQTKLSWAKTSPPEVLSDDVRKGDEDYMTERDADSIPMEASSLGGLHGTPLAQVQKYEHMETEETVQVEAEEFEMTAGMKIAENVEGDGASVQSNKDLPRKEQHCTDDSSGCASGESRNESTS